MTKQQTAAALVMVSVPADPAYAGLRPKLVLRSGSFGLVRFLQKTGWLLVLLVLTIGSYLVFSHYVLRSVRVVGTSMVPTLQEGSDYVLNIWALRHNGPKRNDIVVLRDPGDHGLAVKRVIAVEGESVLLKDGRVYVNGKMLEEPYLLPNTRTFTYSKAKEQFITCGKDQYFVMGDNRLRSIDSRAYGPVSRSDIFGLVELKQGFSATPQFGPKVPIAGR